MLQWIALEYARWYIAFESKHFPEPVEMKWRCGCAGPMLSHCDSVRFGSIRFSGIVASMVVVVDFVVDDGVRWMHGKTMRFLMKGKHTHWLSHNTNTHTQRMLGISDARDGTRQSGCSSAEAHELTWGNHANILRCERKMWTNWLVWIGKGIAHGAILLILAILWANKELTRHIGWVLWQAPFTEMESGKK